MSSNASLICLTLALSFASLCGVAKERSSGGGENISVAKLCVNNTQPDEKIIVSMIAGLPYAGGGLYECIVKGTRKNLNVSDAEAGIDKTFNTGTVKISFTKDSRGQWHEIYANNAEVDLVLLKGQDAILRFRIRNGYSHDYMMLSANDLDEAITIRKIILDTRD